MNKLYRIYTEDRNRELIKAKCDLFAKGYTLIPGAGVWNGKTEKSLVIEIIGNENDQYTKVNPIAQAIQLDNDQETVIVTVSDVNVYTFSE